MVHLPQLFLSLAQLQLFLCDSNCIYLYLPWAPSKVYLDRGRAVKPAGDSRSIGRSTGCRTLRCEPVRTLRLTTTCFVPLAQLTDAQTNCQELFLRNSAVVPGNPERYGVQHISPAPFINRIIVYMEPRVPETFIAPGDPSSIAMNHLPGAFILSVFDQ